MFQGKIFSLELSICHESLWPAAYSTHSFRLTSKPFRHFGHVWLFEFCLKLLGLLLAIHLMLMFFFNIKFFLPFETTQKTWQERNRVQMAFEERISSSITSNI